MPNILRLNSKLDLWEQYRKKEHECGKNIPDNLIDTFAGLCENSRETWYPNIDTIIVLIAVVPGSSCSCERSISKLGLLETCLRTTMTQERLNGLSLLQAHRSINMDYEKLLNMFARDYPKRLQLIDILEDSDSDSEA